MKIKSFLAATFLMLSTNVFASEFVILECGEYNFTPGGIFITEVNSSLKNTPPYLTQGLPCATAIANLMTKGFKMQNSSVISRQFFASNNIVHTYNLVLEP